MEVGEEDYVIVILKSVTEAQCVHACTLRLFILIHIARYIILIVFVVRLNTHTLIRPRIITYSTLAVFRLEVVLPIANVEASSLPLILVGLLVPLDRVYKGFHPLRVQRLVFLQIHDVKLIGVA